MEANDAEPMTLYKNTVGTKLSRAYDMRIVCAGTDR